MTRDWGGGDRRWRTAASAPASAYRCAEQGGRGCCCRRPLSFYRSPAGWMRRRGMASQGAGGGCRASVAANVVAVNLADLSVQNWGTKREARESLTHGPLNRVTAEFAGASATSRSSRVLSVSVTSPLNRVNAPTSTDAAAADFSACPWDVSRFLQHRLLRTMAFVGRRTETPLSDPSTCLVPDAPTSCSCSSSTSDPANGLSSGFTAALLIDA